MEFIYENGDLDYQLEVVERAKGILHTMGTPNLFEAIEYILKKDNKN